ncbi:MAG: hypothetical protein AAFQ36_09575 [Pseudomonadota bacterium]
MHSDLIINVRHFFVATAAIALMGCGAGPLTGPDVPPDVREVFDPSNRYVLAPSGDDLVSVSLDDVSEIAQRTTRDDAATLLRRRNAEHVSIRQVPYLFGSAQGQSYAIAASPKALVRGTPESQCPIRVQIRVEGSEAIASDAIEFALRNCHAEIAEQQLGEVCDCRVLAHDDILHAPLDSFAYARDLPARVFQDGRLNPELYLVREVLIEPGARGLEVFGSDGLLITIDGTEPGPITGNLPDGTSVEGAFQVSGLSRGRYTGAITLAGEGLRIIVGP